MNAWGWFLLIVSWGVILALAAFCFWKVCTAPKQDIHAPLDIDTQDARTKPAHK